MTKEQLNEAKEIVKDLPEVQEIQIANLEKDKDYIIVLTCPMATSAQTYERIVIEMGKLKEKLPNVTFMFFDNGMTVDKILQVND